MHSELKLWILLFWKWNKIDKIWGEGLKRRHGYKFWHFGELEECTSICVTIHTFSKSHLRRRCRGSLHEDRFTIFSSSGITCGAPQRFNLLALTIQCFQNRKYQCANWRQQGQSRLLLVNVQTQPTRRWAAVELRVGTQHHCLGDMQCTGNMLGTLGQLLLCVLQILYLWNTKHLGRQGKYLIRNLEYRKKNYEICVISDLRRLSQPYFRNRQDVIHIN